MNKTVHDTTHACKKQVPMITLSFLLLFAVKVGAEVVYENDFSVRTSKGAIPYGDWRAVPYTPGKLVVDYNTDPFTGSDYQDNWIRHGVGRSPALVVDDNGNQELVASCDVDAFRSFAVLKQRLFNTFSSGIVTAQCDLRVPTTWTGSALYMYANCFRLSDEKFFSPSTASGDIAASVGITQQNGTRQFFRAASNAGSVFNDGASNTNWYRIVLAVNLDTRKWSYAFYDLGTAHPALDTPTPATAAFSESDIDMPNASVTTISAISVTAYNPCGGTGNNINLSQAAQFDNIRVAHNGVECYVNDFTTRRSRNLAPATTTSTYTADCLVTNTVGSETYLVGRSLFPPSTGDGTVPQPVGVDGWRRLNSSGTVTPSVTENSHKRLYYPWAGGYTYGITAVPIGSTLRTGKVRICADVYAIGIHNSELATRGAFLYAGGEGFYTSSSSEFGKVPGEFARIGIIAESKTKVEDGKNVPFRRPACGTANGQWVIGTGDDEWVKQTTWLRFVIEADLDAGTYTAKFLDQGANQPSGDSADSTTNYYERAGISAINPITEISSVGLGSYMTEACFDNIKVWHRPTGAAAETLVYDNRFDSRTIYHQDVRGGRLTGTLWTGPWGQDGWIRTNNGKMNVYVEDDGVNPALAFEGNNSYSYSVHDIGTLLKGGTVITQADVTPSECWSGSERYTIFWLGGDQFHEGNLKGGDASFVKWTAAGFGFRDATSATNSVGQYTNITICAYNGDGVGGGAFVNSNAKVDPSHWYRFVATTSMRGSTSDVAVYDLGTEHPTLATPTPAVPVATFANMRSRHLARDLGGVSCFGMYVNAPLVWNTASTAASLYWDNIRISHNPAGMIIFVK